MKHTTDELIAICRRAALLGAGAPVEMITVEDNTYGGFFVACSHGRDMTRYEAEFAAHAIKHYVAVCAELERRLLAPSDSARVAEGLVEP